ncbi:MAG TPA: hypothetical protein VEG38_03410 [Acidimicrobiia bacterium]|nr:hypothetical protein [Acidimicrobiia bacterium]
MNGSSSAVTRPRYPPIATPSGALANAYARATGIKPRSFPLVREPAGEPVPPGLIPPPAHKSR